jgi:hypothetical protein
MSKKIFMDAFFTQFHEFMGQLIRVFPEDPDFTVYDSGVMMLQKVNPGLVLAEFIKHVTPFEEVIRAKNSDFFIQTEIFIFDPENTMEQVIQKLKAYWIGLSDSNKESIWNYIILLLDISKRCV